MGEKDFLVTPLFDRMDWAAGILNVPREVMEEELKRFKIREMTADRMRVHLDNGRYASFTATVVLHYLPYPGDKPYKGGIRLSDRVSPDILRMLALEMTLKCGVVDLEFGGAKSGISLPRPVYSYSKREIAAIVEAYAEYFIKFGIIRPDFYVPATDVGTTSEHMDIIHNFYNSNVKSRVPGACVTGRSVDYGGLPVREEATALGGLIVLEGVLNKVKVPGLGERPTVIVQGLGQVGASFVRLANRDQRYKIVGLGNISGAVYNPAGINLDWLPADRNAPLVYVEGQECSGEELLLKPCDILVPAAIENVITADNADKISAKVVLELANHPTTDAAHDALVKKGVCVIPDILANAGGVTASFYEWSQSFGPPHHRIEIAEINAMVRNRIIEVMNNSTSQVLEFASRYGTDLRGAAWLKAVDKIAREISHKHKKWLSTS